MQIQQNFLKHGTFQELKREIISPDFTWHYAMAPGEPEQYCRILYWDHSFNCDSKLMRLLRTITNQLNAIAILKIKVNATTRNAPEQLWHRDWNISTPSKTCIIYLNNSNGYTEIEETGLKIDSVENTAVIFDTNTRHRGVPQTDVDRRLVMNITYFER